MADYFSHGGRAVQVYNSVRFIEIPCRICREISDGTLEYAMGCWLFQLVFTQTGWFLLDAGMNRATEGTPTFVARSPDGTTTTKEWTTRMCQLMAKKPGEGGKGKPLLRSEVRPSQGTYGCLSGSCGEGCGMPGMGGDMCLECEVIDLVLGGLEGPISSGRGHACPCAYAMVR